MNRDRLRAFAALALSALLLPVGCSSPSSTGSGNNGGTGGGTGNVATITVNTGPFVDYVNGAFTSVTVCVPGSTTQCQTIGGILVDTGSYGLRIEQSALNLTLPQQNDSNNNPVVECGEFASGFTWGPVQTADFTIAGEKASSLPIQVMGSASFPDTETTGGAATCADGDAGTSVDYDNAENLGANGILGVGSFAQDCGTGCVASGAPGFYYACPTAATCATTTEALTSQVTNPVALFATDNNGVVIELPSVPVATIATSITGSLIFGIGTESNNGLGNATIYDVDPTTGNFTTVFVGNTYTDAAFLDSGSDALYFDPTNTNLLECTDLDDAFYCPNSPTGFTATNEGTNGTSGQVSFTVADADAFFDSNATEGVDGVFNGLAGPFPGTFDWGLPFFFGVSAVYTAIAGQTTPGGSGPYYAY